MRFETIEIDDNSKYSFIVGTAEKPDNALRESIRARIREAMEALGRKEDSFAVSILQNKEPEEARDTAYPELRPSKDYLLFAMLRSSNPAESLTDRELEEHREEIARGIFLPEKSRIALVLLYDSSLGIIVTKLPTYANVISYVDSPPRAARRGSRRGY